MNRAHSSASLTGEKGLLQVPSIRSVSEYSLDEYFTPQSSIAPKEGKRVQLAVPAIKVSSCSSELSVSSVPVSPFRADCFSVTPSVFTTLSAAMDRASRRFSTITQLNPEHLRRAVEKANGVPDRRVSLEDGGLGRKMTGTFGNLALFKDDDECANTGAASSMFSAYTTPGPKEKAISEHGKKANLGVMLGVYLPTIQHILGVTMFIRLFWVVGMAGLGYSSLILALCCLCTFLTTVSLSAVATNGVVESGGAYFMISRNLGAEFGSAVGILFYLANTVATSMYLVGGVEVMLMYLFPEWELPLEFGHEHTDAEEHGLFSKRLNNFRLYGTFFLLLEVLIVAMGVKFVQLMAPVSLMCVIAAVLAVFAGGVDKMINQNGQRVCMLNDSLIMSKPMVEQALGLGLTRENISDDYCVLCDKSVITDLYCGGHHFEDRGCTQLLAHEVECINGFPGFNVATLMGNLHGSFLSAGESKPFTKGIRKVEVTQDRDTSFWILLAIWFPAVTGIFTGTNMSGDLADPQRSIPGGTIAATTTTSIIYFTLSVVFAFCVDRSVLRDKFGQATDNVMIVAELSWPTHWIVTIGSFLSTFGAALQCLCSAPRLLQSIAKDDVIPFLAPFARVTKNNEPFLGLLMTAFIAECAILLGEVDAIAEVLDFFFLMCYASVNLICFLHSVLKAPNWRPRFKYYHWSLALLGAFLCFFIMFTSDYKKALIACILTMSIYKYVEWKGAKKEWGDGIRGLALTTAQYSLLKVEDKDPHPKNWRPQLMVMLASQWSREMQDRRVMSLLNLAAQLKAGRGLAIVVALLKQTEKNHFTRKRCQEIKEEITNDMCSAKLRGFGKTVLYAQGQVHGSISALFQSIGIGGLRPNTILFNWPNFDEYDDLVLFAEKMVLAIQNENCVILSKGITEFPCSTDRMTGTIDIWWIVQDGGILVLIAYLLKQHKVWKGCRLRIFAISETTDTERIDAIEKNLQKHIYQLRIDAELFVVNLTDEEIGNEVFDKTQEMESKRLSRLEEMRARSRSMGYSNDGYVSDDISRADSRAGGLDRSASTMIRISEDGETSFTQNRYDDLYGDDTSSLTEQNGTGTQQKLNVHKMNTSVRLNRVIMENSPDSQLILLTLPSPPKKRDLLIHSYMTYLDVLSEGLRRVLFIGGSGKEVITIQS